MNQQPVQRNWSSYNLAQTSEKFLAMKILNEAVECLQTPYIYKGNGRPHIGLEDMLRSEGVQQLLFQENDGRDRNRLRPAIHPRDSPLQFHQ